MLELARDLLARAEAVAAYPMPAVFNLSSWAERRLPLAIWLVDELNIRYDVPKKIGQAWVEDDALLPLLDGLDEVNLEYRAECAEAINAFRREHGLVSIVVCMSIVVCSRVTDYESLTTRLLAIRPTDWWTGVVHTWQSTPRQLPSNNFRLASMVGHVSACPIQSISSRIRQHTC